MADILERMVLLARDGTEIMTVYGRRRSAETDETAGAVLVGYQDTREVLDVAWSTSLVSALPRVHRVQRDGVLYRLDSHARRDQRTVRIFLGAAQ